MRILLSGLLVAALALVLAGVRPAVHPGTASPALRPVAAAPRVALRPVAFRSRFGSGLLNRRRSYGGYYTPRSRHPVLRTVGRTLFWTWLLHLFLFRSGVGSLLLWIAIIAIVVHLFRRRRRRLAY